MNQILSKMLKGAHTSYIEHISHRFYGGPCIKCKNELVSVNWKIIHQVVKHGNFTVGSSISNMKIQIPSVC